MTGGLFPRLPRKCRGDSIVPNSWKSPNLSSSVSVVAEIPASGPRLGREPAVTEGSGIRPGIASDSVVTTASSHGEKMEDKLRLRLKQINEKHVQLCALCLLSYILGHTIWYEGRKAILQLLAAHRHVRAVFVTALQEGIVMCLRCTVPL